MKGSLSTSQFNYESAVRLKHQFQGTNIFYKYINTGLDLDSIITNLEKEPGVDKEMNFFNEAGLKGQQGHRLSYNIFEIQDNKLVKKDIENI